MLWTAAFMVSIIFIQIAQSREFLLNLRSSAPAMRGSVVTFTADLLELNGTKVNVGDTLKWEWLIDDHEKQEFRTTEPHAEWTYQFPRHSNKNPNKAYKVEVNVGQWYLFFSYPMATSTIKVNLTATLNGQLKLTQSGTRMKSLNVSTAVPLEQELDIRREDLDSIKNATSTVVHWFVDCQYVRQTNEFRTQHIFKEPNKTHHIEALIEASFEPIPAKPLPTLKSKLISSWQSEYKVNLPYVCHNQSKIQPNPNKVYGHFEINATAYDAISDLFVNGTSWINDGDDYQLNIYCNGSPKFDYCVRQIDGPYILDGNETCDEWISIGECHQNLKFTQSVVNVKSFTVLVIIRNSVSTERKLFVVNINQPIIVIAAMVGTFVFTLCIIGVVVCCLVRCLRKKKRTSKITARSDAEATLIGHKPVTITETKLIPSKNIS